MLEIFYYFGNALKKVKNFSDFCPPTLQDGALCKDQKNSTTLQLLLHDFYT